MKDNIMIHIERFSIIHKEGDIYHQREELLHCPLPHLGLPPPHLPILLVGPAAAAKIQIFNSFTAFNWKKEK